MVPVYKENIETVMTYVEWEKIHNQKEKERQAERNYYIKQKVCGGIMILIGLAIPLICGDAAFSVIALPLGAGLIFTKKKVMMF